MKKILLSISLLFVFGAYVLYASNGKMQAMADVLVPNEYQTGLGVNSKVQANMYRDSRYIGNKADAYYGIVQVAVTISDGKLAKVQALEYPKNQQNSTRLNDQAIPRLTSEAVTIQSANVDSVTGASLTSAAFLESLSIALAQASSTKLQ